MKNNTLLQPLVYSALILILFSTLFYLVASSPETTTFAALQNSFLMIIFRAIQWLIAMLIALGACLAFLFAIFLGAVSLFDREVAAQMYQGLKNNLLNTLTPGQCCTCTSAQ